jgi:acetyl-CoA synthetase
MVTPEQFNFADAICKRHDDAVARIAVIEVKPFANNTYTYGGLDFISDKFATTLAECGVKQGDSVAVILPQSAALITTHLGVLKLGAVVVPLAVSLDRAAIEFALRDSNAKAVVADFSIRAEIADLTGNTPLLIAGDSREANELKDGAKSFWREIHEASSDFTAVETMSTSPAFIFYNDGSPGVIHNHASLIEQLAAFEMFYNFDINDESTFQTSSDWCSVEVLLGMIYPALWYGCVVVAKES